MVMYLSKFTNLTYLNLCLIKIITNDSEFLFNKEDIRQVTCAVINNIKKLNQDNENTYIDEWLFKYNKYRFEDTDSEYKTAKKELFNILSNNPLENDNFLNDIYFNIEDLIVNGVVNELLSYNLLESHSLDNYKLINNLKNTNIIEILNPKPNNIYISYHNNKYGFVTSKDNYDDFIKWKIYKFNDKTIAEVSTKRYTKNTSLFNCLCWLYCDSLDFYIKSFLKEDL